ncbi:MAG: DUF4326 domain-containing protein [Nitrososphaeraceae archaeon]
MMVAKVVHCKKEKYDIYIGRPSRWGNPFVIGKDGTREVITKYNEWFFKPEQAQLRKDARVELRNIYANDLNRGKTKIV